MGDPFLFNYFSLWRIVYCYFLCLYEYMRCVV